MKSFLVAAALGVSLGAINHPAAAQGKAAAWPKEPTSVFGIPLGGEMKDEDLRDCGGIHDPSQEYPVAVCALKKGMFGGDVLIAHIPIDSMDDGVVQRKDFVVKSVMVNAKHENYRDVKAVLIERYGRPTSTKKETLQNGYGAKFSSEVLHWQGRRVSLTLHERTSAADKTAFIFLDNSKSDAAAASACEKRKADAARL